MGSRAAIRPIELGRRLVREMDDQRSVDVKGRRVVPNDFEIHLSPRDLAGFDDIHDVLQTELVEAAREYAREEGYHFMGPVRGRADRRRAAQPRPLRRRRARCARAPAGSAAGRSCCRRASGSRSATGRSRSGGCSECTHPAQRPERQPPPRRDPPGPRRLRRRRPRLDERHDGQRHAHRRRAAPGRRRHHQLRLDLRTIRGVVGPTAPAREANDRPGARHPQAGPAGPAVPLLRPRPVGGVERGAQRQQPGHRAARPARRHRTPPPSPRPCRDASAGATARRRAAAARSPAS